MVLGHVDCQGHVRAGNTFTFINIFNLILIDFRAQTSEGQSAPVLKQEGTISPPPPCGDGPACSTFDSVNRLETQTQAQDEHLHRFALSTHVTTRPYAHCTGIRHRENFTLSASHAYGAGRRQNPPTDESACQHKTNGPQTRDENLSPMSHSTVNKATQTRDAG